MEPDMIRQLLILTTFTLLAGCQLIYEKTIHQGVKVDQADYQKISTGMSKQDVINTLGAPLMENLNPDRLVYVNSTKLAHKAPVSGHVTITFKNNKVTQISRTS
jgi:outer membrane protein assembly factor BamE (lipoprotein component of BamABCDE complex)